MNQPTSMCYGDFFSEMLVGATSTNSISSFDIPTTESDTEQGDTLTAWANQDDIEMAHEFADPNPPERSPSVPVDQPQWLGPDRFVEMYEGCAEQFSGGRTFMDEFRNDRYTEERQQNLYFPWASWREWAFASWLLRSRLSMAAIDSLLSLELVK